MHLVVITHFKRLITATWAPSCHSSSCEWRRGGWICGDSSDSAAVVHSVLIQISCYWRTIASIHPLAIITIEHTVAACIPFTPITNQHVAVIIIKRQPWAQLQSWTAPWAHIYSHSHKEGVRAAVSESAFFLSLCLSMQPQLRVHLDALSQPADI